ncbi:hypothetical protein BZM26_36095 [Paraburkholderia strydomiana]|nr:hypothetical protein BZM26_36095 [Paraburkholderia strydomiana]
MPGKRDRSRFVLRDCGMPEGAFSVLFDSGRDIAQSLVGDRRITAVGFTGSRGGGTALMKLAAQRPEPIRVYAEMSSVNSVLLFPATLANRAEALAGHSPRRSRSVLVSSYEPRSDSRGELVRSGSVHRRRCRRTG